MNKNILVGLIVSIFIFSSCAHNSYDNGVSYKREYEVKTNFKTTTVEETVINYKILSNQAVTQIFKNSKVPNKLIVTEFVDLTLLENHTKLGYVLSNSIKNSLINIHNASVIEAEVSKYFKISGNGLKILSRDINMIKNKNLTVERAVVGTYAYTDDEIIIFVKLVNLKTGIIEGSYTKAIEMGRSTRMLLNINCKASCK